MIIFVCFDICSINLSNVRGDSAEEGGSGMTVFSEDV
jgi:hypothetical protein